MDSATGFFGLIALIALFVSFMITLALVVSKQHRLPDKDETSDKREAQNQA